VTRDGVWTTCSPFCDLQHPDIVLQALQMDACGVICNLFVLPDDAPGAVDLHRIFIRTTTFLLAPRSQTMFLCLQAPRSATCAPTCRPSLVSRDRAPRFARGTAHALGAIAGSCRGKRVETASTNIRCAYTSRCARARHPAGDLDWCDHRGGLEEATAAGAATLPIPSS